jgi:hypothetical protein
MNALNQVDYFEPTTMKVLPDPHESVLMECGRLIHAAVISKRFLNTLLTNPIQSIEAGFCGEKFSFTREEKQKIQQIHANSLAEFSNLLIQAVKQPCHVLPAPDMAFAQLEARTELPA